MGFPRRACASLFALPLVLAGCSGSLTESGKIDYKSAAQVRPLEVPPDLTAPSRDDRFAVPDSAGKGVATFSGYSADRAGKPRTATATEVLPAGEGMVIERAGSQRWLVIRGDADRLWPQVRQFWLDLGFIIDVEQPDIGVMETDWAEDRAKIPQDWVRDTLGKIFDSLFSTPIRDKFRTRFERGQQPGTVEVYITHRGMMEIYPNEARDSTVWQPRPADPELEAEMLRRLMVRLGAGEAQAKAQADKAPAVERARLDLPATGDVGLRMTDPFDRAWRRVGLALDRVGFTVQDRNRADGVYYVRYMDPDRGVNEEQKGFLSRLAFWREDKSGITHGNEYQIRVQGDDKGSVVKVLRKEGGTDQSETARRILGLLQEQLR